MAAEVKPLAPTKLAAQTIESDSRTNILAQFQVPSKPDFTLKSWHHPCLTAYEPHERQFFLRLLCSHDWRKSATISPIEHESL